LAETTVQGSCSVAGKAGLSPLSVIFCLSFWWRLQLQATQYAKPCEKIQPKKNA